MTAPSQKQRRKQRDVVVASQNLREVVGEGGCDYTVSVFDTEDCGLLRLSFHPPICRAVSENDHMGHFGSQ